MSTYSCCRHCAYRSDSDGYRYCVMLSASERTAHESPCACQDPK